MRKPLSIITMAAVLSTTPALANHHDETKSQKCKVPKFIEVNTNWKGKLLIAIPNIIQVHPSTADMPSSDVPIVISLGSTHHTIAADDQLYNSVKKRLCGADIKPV